MKTFNLEGLSKQAQDAVTGAIATKGTYKGFLHRSAPRSNTLAYAARQAILMRVNPFKVSIGGVMFLSEEQKAIYTEVSLWIDKQPLREAIKFDKDRSELTGLGVW